MSISAEAFESWCYRHGGETYDHDDWPGIAYQFPDAETHEGVYYYPANNSFDVITEGHFYTVRSLHQHADSWIDDDDRLHIDTDETRVVIDPR
jgi:hypothetical protein